jgi:hypothetical protein
MVLWAPARIKKLKDEARRERDADWQAWLSRRDAAIANGEPFDEPSPAGKDRINERA